MRTIMSAIVAIALVLAAASAEAWTGRHGFVHDRAHVVIVPHLWAGPRAWYPYGYAYAPPVVVEPSPPVYVQQAPSGTSWYYCSSAAAYYPYVQQCPEGWTTVTPPAAAPGQ